jgi:recombination associated protein RdgC
VVDGHWLLKLQREQRLLPGSVVTERVDELAEQIEHQTGRKPGKKARKDLKEQAAHELLPRAFTKTGATRVWMAPASACCWWMPAASRGPTRSRRC